MSASKKQDAERLEQLRDMVRRQILQLEVSKETITLADFSRTMKTCLDLEKAIAALTGEGAEITDAKLLRSATWERVQSRIMRALEPWPAALQAVGEALRAMAEEG